jgi:predicted TPR repeat methyltransferase
VSPKGGLSRELQEAKKIHGQGDLARARASYRAILEKEPDQTEALHFLGIALHQMGEWGEANPKLAQSLMEQPGNAEWWNNYGNVLTQRNQLKDAEDAFKRVVSLKPNSADSWCNLGSVRQRREAFSEAEEAYREALKINPRMEVALKLLGGMLQQQNRTMEGARLIAQALVSGSDPDATPLGIAKAWIILDRPDKAAEIYAKLMMQHPDDPVPAFLHAACTGINVPQECSRGYIAATFDNYAPNFDAGQVKLSYRGPEMLGELLAEIPLPPLPLDILDLGCGTGLCANILKPLARTLIGVDLSAKMLERAAETHLYSQLAVADVVDYMNEHPQSFDLLTAAECFIYFGNLEKVFASIRAASKPEGICIFTIESLGDSDGPYKLHSIGRYCHADSYLKSLIQQHGFDVIRVNRGVVRIELCLPVHGSIWAIRRRKEA